MGKFHSTMSRRQFMEALGLAGAGLGAAAIAAPTFHDMDEVLASSSNSSWKNPWWVKNREAENPTVEIDWSRIQRYDMNQVQTGDYQAIQDKTNAMIKEMWGSNDSKELYKKWAQEGVQGLRLREQAVSNAIGAVQNGAKSGYTGITPDGLGVPRWQGTPEENMHMMHVVSRFFGSITQSATQLTDNTKKLIFSKVGNRTNVFKDVDQASQTATESILPNKANYAFAWGTRHPSDALKTGPGVVNNPYGYFFSTNAGVRIRQFVQNIGYLAVSSQPNLAGSSAFPAVTGMGEMSRAGSELMIPQHGNVLRYIDLMLTDLPLESTPPIDAGMTRFCYTCKKCAIHCPTQSISLEDPSWDTTGPWNNPGMKHWYFNYPSCNPFKSSFTPGYCGLCLTICTFTKYEDAMIHNIVKGTSSTTPVFNAFFHKMDDAMGYGRNRGGLEAHQDDTYVDDWWNIIGPELGFLTHRGNFPG
ncbi:reductive dehalogenase [Dehalogenimonas formicexedens]|uniref:Reductive dehalogenase n=1 Tax=Dehalogenimonas formicexedens TaxID=1839801 RepID=A0A1P8F5J2_9CHLR|nr:reductive dehalogenase [Dehalogenimonas formicexedens]APV43700.1 reductive dehalogenase [Dehalogenimonas formicexedens]